MGLYLCKTPGKNYGLHLVNETVDKYFALKKAVNRGDFEGLNPFFQSDSDPLNSLWKQEILIEDGLGFDHSYLFIEFWSDNYSLMLDKSIAFATTLGIVLSLDSF
jgi:hypothetical protein